MLQRADGGHLEWESLKFSRKICPSAFAVQVFQSIPFLFSVVYERITFRIHSRVKPADYVAQMKSAGKIWNTGTRFFNIFLCALWFRVTCCPFLFLLGLEAQRNTTPSLLYCISVWMQHHGILLLKSEFFESLLLFSLTITTPVLFITAVHVKLVFVFQNDRGW